MHKHIGRLFLAVSIICLPLVTSHTALAQSEDAYTVIISELGWAGSSQNASDEWIELTNLTDETIDVGGWTIDGAATSNGALALPENSLVAPHQSLLISNYGNADAKSTLERIPDMVTASVSLSNSALSITLSDSAGVVRDRAGDASSPLAGSTGEVIASMMRSIPLGDGTLETSWLTATSASGFDPGAMEFGTPGTAEEWFVPSPAAAAASDEPTVNETQVEPTLVVEEPAPVVENTATEQPNGENADTVVTPEDMTVAPSDESMTSDAAKSEAAIFDEVVYPDTQVETDVPSDVPAASDEPVASIETVAVEPETEQTTESAESVNDMNAVETSATETEIAIPTETVEQTSAEPEIELVPTDTAETIPVETQTLLINELASDADTEWIEILNAGDDAVVLTGWTVRDATLKTTALPNELLEPWQFVVVYDPSGKLNNDGDIVELLDPTGTVVDSVEYGTSEVSAAEKPNALARDESGEWLVTAAPTPCAANSIVEESDASGMETETAETDAADPISEVSTDTPETTAAETDTQTESPAESNGNLIMNELVSDADAEWIEILNAGDDAVALGGWTVRDATLKATALPDQTLAAGQFVVVYDPSGKLNNDGDTVELLNPAGMVVDSVEYGTDAVPAADKPNSLARGENGEWRVTETSTPGAANAMTTESVDESTASNDDSASDDPMTTTSDTTTGGTSSGTHDSPVEETWSGPITLRLSEFYPNTTGDDLVEEFIEIENVGTEDVDLVGWSLLDATNHEYLFVSSNVIEPGDLLALMRDETDIALNNTTDSVTLVAPDGSIVDTKSYASPPKGSSLIRSDAKWVWTRTPTPNEPNALPVNETTGSTAGSTTSKTPSSNVAATSGARRSVMARVEGTVLVEPGALGKQIFYIETEDGGLQIYKYDSDFPDLAPGDRVLVTGVMTESRAEARLKVSDGGTITVLSGGTIPTAEDATIGNLTPADHGRLVRVSGTILSRSGSKAVIEDQGARLTVRVADGTGINAALLARGTSVTITGVLVSTDSGLTLLPRSAEDVEVAELQSSETAAAATTGTNAQDGQNRAIAFAITAAVIAGLALYSSRRIIRAVTHWYAKAHALRAASQTAH
ncbi:hypothetical protein A2304_03485 [Candidatus Uhrbacteria bacterium RIFOXYB2_FULL_57_15]|uniref:LTD domain-containing protein n=1 Tax=Candidatus Uhrbacteria bacterium RIFOXYB2_FULL_57_15 TaxID=1802422 RepID=A0A1F7W6W8_9BACT|nr:MAG: hypothetical protein A2304_03485 [Candidatus Uhrbacteria bacterium RIFOXYB2_FULL_57_15]OGM00102.1 MAG: hypothetical protein A2501_01140 [Candidatus Uhrbacteria bacterium RIFOXYC12_FULL_57_11]